MCYSRCCNYAASILQIRFYLSESSTYIVCIIEILLSRLYCKLRDKLRGDLSGFPTPRVTNCPIYKHTKNDIFSRPEICISEILNIYISHDGSCWTATALPITRCRICKRYDARNWSSELERPRRSACSSAIVCQLDLIGNMPYSAVIWRWKRTERKAKKLARGTRALVNYNSCPSISIIVPVINNHIYLGHFA